MTSECPGAFCGEGVNLGLDGSGVDAFFLPNEKLLPPARNDNVCGSGIGGIGIFRDSMGFGRGFSSKGASVEEGRVDDELNRAEDEELSFWPPLEAELFVPPLPLKIISRFGLQFGCTDIPITQDWTRPAVDKDVIVQMRSSAQRAALTHSLQSIPAIEGLTTWPLKDTE